MRHRRSLPSPRGTKKMKSFRMRTVLICFFVLTCTYVVYSTYHEEPALKKSSLVRNSDIESQDTAGTDPDGDSQKDIPVRQGGGDGKDNPHGDVGGQGVETGGEGQQGKGVQPPGGNDGDVNAGPNQGNGGTAGENAKGDDTDGGAKEVGAEGQAGDKPEGGDQQQPADKQDAGAAGQANTGAGQGSQQGGDPPLSADGAAAHNVQSQPGANDLADGHNHGGVASQEQPTQPKTGDEKKKEGAETAVQTPVMSEKERIAALERKLSHIERSVQRDRVHSYMEVPYLNIDKRKRILITGGAGFVGSHLVDKLMLQGHEVTVADNFFTGRKRNVEHWLGHENFELINHDVVMPLFLEVDEIYHLASPASPPHYMRNPVKTIKCNTLGTINVLGLAKRVNARVLFASTSEVYGDPEEHPQKEEYWGHVNPIGPRACYDESKRVGETLCISYAKQDKVKVRIARIFNTYGPRMHINDGRVVSNFILQALQGKDITIYGEGNQTRSFQYVDDLVNGLVALMGSNVTSPINIGNPQEQTIADFAQMIHKTVGGSSKVVKLPPVEDDPRKRKPDISKAKAHLKWEPQVSLEKGIGETVKYFRGELERSKHSERNVYLPKAEL